MASKIIGDVSVITIFLYLVMQISRFVSKKFLQDNYFQNELHFPTTDYLLFSNDKYSLERKEKIRGKVKKDFGVMLLDKEKEVMDEKEARKKISEAVSLIRNKVKNGRLLLQHNIEYGFIRNLIGGLSISIPFCLFDIFFFGIRSDETAFIVSLLLFIGYFSFFVFRRNILVYYAYNYADVLYNEYLSI